MSRRTNKPIYKRSLVGKAPDVFERTSRATGLKAIQFNQPHPKEDIRPGQVGCGFQQIAVF